MPPVQAASTHVNTLVYQGDPTWWIIWCRWSRSVARFSPLMPTSTIFPLLCRLFTAVLLWYAEVVHHRWLQHPDQPESSGPLQFNHPQDWHHECRDQDGAASASQTKTPGPECIDSFWFLKLDWPNWSYTSVQNSPPSPPLLFKWTDLVFPSFCVPYFLSNKYGTLKALSPNPHRCHCSLSPTSFPVSFSSLFHLKHQIILI